jgi:hypothetical protein
MADCQSQFELQVWHDSTRHKQYSDLDICFIVKCYIMAEDLL